MTTRHGLLLGASIFVCALLWVLVAWPVPSGSTEPTPSRPPPATPPPEPERQPEVTATHEPPPRADPEPPPPQAAPDEPPQTEPSMFVVNQLFAEPRGPIEEFRQQYAAEPRDSAASDVERTVRNAFDPEHASSQLLRSVLCRQTICRIEVRWTERELGNYVAAMGRMSGDFDQTIAAAPLAAAVSGEERQPVELLLRRRPHHVGLMSAE